MYDIPSTDSLVPLTELHEKNKIGIISVKVKSVEGPRRSHSNWNYMWLRIQDDSITGSLQIGEAEFAKWQVRKGDSIICKVKSLGLDDNSNILAVRFFDFVGELDASRILYETAHALKQARTRIAERSQKPETLYQLGDRGAESFVKLMELYLNERVPQHYNKWAHIHQIAATDLFYMGLVKRVGFMTGLYYPSDDGLRFYRGKIKYPTRKRIIRRGDTVIEEIPEGTPELTIEELLDKHQDRESILAAYKETMKKWSDELDYGI
jgi:hypothetical protein